MVALVGVAAGAGAAFFSTYLGFGAGKALGVGALVAGGLAWLIGRHDKNLHPCTLFFIPLRFYAVVTALAGAFFFISPERPSAPKDARLNLIEERLRQEKVTGSSGAAQEVAARYAALKDASLGTDEKSFHLELDSNDPKTAKKASLYVKASRLKTYGDEGKKALCAAYLKILRADFPQSVCNVAIRGPLLWGCRARPRRATARPRSGSPPTPPRSERRTRHCSRILPPLAGDMRYSSGESVWSEILAAPASFCTLFMSRGVVFVGASQEPTP